MFEERQTVSKWIKFQSFFETKRHSVEYGWMEKSLIVNKYDDDKNYFMDYKKNHDDKDVVD